MKNLWKWFRWVILAVASLVCGLVGYAMLSALSTQHPVGFQVIQLADEDGQAFAAGVWYPTQSRPWPTTLLGVVLMDVARDAPVSGSDLPLVVISYGNGGSAASHADLACPWQTPGILSQLPCTLVITSRSERCCFCLMVTWTYPRASCDSHLYAHALARP